jgi:hypothetical protein
VTLKSTKFFIRRTKMLEFLSDIEQTSGAGAVSIYLPSGFSLTEIGNPLDKGGVQPPPDEIFQMASNSKSGAVLFWGDMRKCLVLPPFPLGERAIFDGYVTEPLCRLLASDFTVGLALLHLGSYAVGICRGERIISSKVGTGLIHRRHKKGGSSQQRFQRRRKNQIQAFLDRVCFHIQEHFGPHALVIDYVVYGGPRQTALLLQKRCPFLQSLESRVLFLPDVPSLRQRVLETAVGRIWSTCVIVWQKE